MHMYDVADRYSKNFPGEFGETVSYTGARNIASSWVFFLDNGYQAAR